MDRIQAEQLAERIRYEAPYLAVTSKLIIFVGGQSWAVSIAARSSGLHLANIESPPEWDELKQTLQNRLPPNNR